MGGIVFDEQVTAGTVLVREAIQSPDYVAGVSGWQININGSAEFSSGTFRGTITASSFVTGTAGRRIEINVAGSQSMVFYDANNKVILSIGDLAGALTSYPSGATSNALQIVGAQLQFLWSGGGGIYTPMAFIENNATAVMLNTQLAGGVAFDAVHAALVWIHAGSTTLETWQTPAPFSANWAGTTTLNAQTGTKSIQYRKDVQDNVVICGAALSSGTGTIIFVLPVAYRPAERQVIPCYYLIGTTPTPGFVQVTVAGQVACSATISGVTVAAGTQVYINGSFPMGNIS